MINRFHVLNVGQIDLDNVGIDGTPANDRRYPNERLSEVFWTTRRMASNSHFAGMTDFHGFSRREQVVFVVD